MVFIVILSVSLLNRAMYESNIIKKRASPVGELLSFANPQLLIRESSGTTQSDSLTNSSVMCGDDDTGFDSLKRFESQV